MRPHGPEQGYREGKQPLQSKQSAQAVSAACEEGHLYAGALLLAAIASIFFGLAIATPGAWKTMLALEEAGV